MTSRTLSALRTAAIIALIVLALPQTRSILIAQISQFGNIFVPKSWLVSPSGIVIFDPQTFYTLGDDQRKVPRNAAEALAAAERKAYQVEKDESGVSEREWGHAYSDAVKRYSSDPAIWAGQLRYLSMRDPFGRPRVKPYRHAQTPEQQRLYDRARGAEAVVLAERVKMMEQAIENGRRLEPDNLYFDLFDAYVKFGQGRNEEGLTAIHRASMKQHYNAHTNDAALALIKYDNLPDTLKWMSLDRKIRIYFSTALSHLARFRDTAKSAVRASDQGLKAGDPKAVESMVDLVRLGAVMGRESRDVITVLVGQTIMTQGVKAVLPQAVTPPSQSPSNMQELNAVLAKLKPQDRDHLTPAQWDFVSSNVSHSADVSLRIKKFVKKSLGLEGILLTGIQLAMWNIAVRMLLQTALLLLIGFVSYGWLRRRGLNESQSPAPGSLTIWLLAVVPPALALAFTGFILGVRSWNYDAIALSSTSNAALLVLLNVLTPLLVVVIALIGARSASSDGRSLSDSFFTRLRRGSLIGVKALLITYCVVMIACVIITTRANRQIDRVTDNEVRLIYEPRINGN